MSLAAPEELPPDPHAASAPAPATAIANLSQMTVQNQLVQDEANIQKVKDSNSNQSYLSNVPIHVFRYLMLNDGTWSYYYTPKRKPGYVVEGYCWSNGLIYQVREDKTQNFQTYEVILLIDGYVKSLHSFP